MRGSGVGATATGWSSGVTAREGELHPVRLDVANGWGGVVKMCFGTKTAEGQENRYGEVVFRMKGVEKEERDQ